MSEPSAAVAPDTAAPAGLAALWARLRPLADALFGIDLRALAALRIGMALILLGDLFTRAREIEAHYTEFGVTPRDAVFLHDGDRWALLSPYMWVDGVVPVALLMTLAAVFAVMLLLGWKTRFAVIASYFLLLGIQGRNPMILHGADLTLRVTLFWSMFTPLGVRWSLDASAAQWRREGRTIPARALSAGTLGLLLQIGILYWMTALEKSAPEWRRDYTALYYALSIEQYQSPVGRWLLYNAAPLLKPLTFVAWWMEMLGPTLVFLPLTPALIARARLVIASSFMVFHLVLLNLSFDLGPFPYIATLIWVAFLPGLAWDRLEAWAKALTARSPRLASPPGAAWLRARRDAIVARRMAARRSAPGIALGIEWQTVAAFLVLYVVLWNVRSLDWARRADLIPEPVAFVGRMLRLDQGWGMFAPRPLVEDGWFVMPAKLMGDKDFSFDLRTGNKPIDWTKPVRVASMYPHERWRKYLMNLWVTDHTLQRLYYARWVCRNWNRAHKGGERLDRVQVVYMLKATRPDYRPYKVEPKLLWNHYCYDIPGYDIPGASHPPGWVRPANAKTVAPEDEPTK